METIAQKIPGPLTSYNTIKSGKYHYDFLYCQNTFQNVYESDIEGLIEFEESFIQRAKRKMEELNGHEPYIIIKTYQKHYPNVLNSRVCMTRLLNYKEGKLIGVIWFDDGQKDMRDSLEEIFEAVDWSLSREYID